MEGKSNFVEYGDQFPKEIRKKQTLANLVVAIDIIQIYDLVDWTFYIMNLILINGNSATNFKLNLLHSVGGTIFLVKLKQFYFYKTLRLFFLMTTSKVRLTKNFLLLVKSKKASSFCTIV